MKKQILSIVILLIATVTFAQKKEIKKAGKAFDGGDYTEAMNYLNQAEADLASADDDEKALYYLYRGHVLSKTAKKDLEKLKLAAQAYLEAKKINSSDISDQLETGMQNLKSLLVNSAIDDQTVKKYDIASQKLYQSYLISPQDTSYLYYSAANALNDQNYDTALEYLIKLNELGFTGITTEYTAIDVETKEVIAFTSLSQRDLSVKSEVYSNPSVRVTPSLRGEILRYMTLIYKEQGNEDKAMELIKDAREENPDDVSLIHAEADMAYNKGNLEKYTELMNLIIASDPQNPDLYFNLGVSSNELGDYSKAKKYYKKVLELDPKYTSAQINMASIILKDEGVIIDEMNSLGTSVADNKRYDELKQERKALYIEVAKFLEPAYKNDPNNIEVVRTLMNIYSQTGDDAKFKIMKAKVEELEDN